MCSACRIESMLDIISRACRTMAGSWLVWMLKDGGHFTRPIEESFLSIAVFEGGSMPDEMSPP